MRVIRTEFNSYHRGYSGKSVAVQVTNNQHAGFVNLSKNQDVTACVSGLKYEFAIEDYDVIGFYYSNSKMPITKLV